MAGGVVRGESGFPRRAGLTRTQGWPCHVVVHSAHKAHARAMSLQAKWAWTGGAATAVMDLEGRGVGGGTVATKTAHLSKITVRKTRQHGTKSCGFATSVGLSENCSALQ